MTRMEALEALATAAVAYFRGGLRAEHYPALLDAVDRLPDPLPAATPGEVVEALDIRAVCLQAVEAKLASVPKPRSYEMAHYCMGLEDASLAIQAKIAARLALVKEAGDAD